MLTRGEVDARLRIVRYGVIVVVVITFVTVLVAPFAFTREYFEGTDLEVSVTDFLTEAILAAIIALVIGIVVYVAYHYALKKQLPVIGSSQSSDTTSTE
ncbi:MAG: hypothetical protein D6737_19080 [Chloroflexi bacterium]|nr:MAG: hypothetical protein CUN54_06795 [Phototrophicales bacterium]RMF76945.1 MAG: hypothetical protein D6737_19080 [Chloroflexota bacterium]